MSLPCVVIAGRPNVGKSSLFNRMLGRMAAVVSDREGVTRDRHYQEREHDGKRFNLVDTGGFMPRVEGVIDEQVRDQIGAALDEADVVLFVIDGRAGVTAQDQEFARMVLRRKRPVILVVNKAEKPETAREAVEAWSLGMGEPFPVSAISGFGIRDLMDRFTAMLPSSAPAPRENVLRLAVLGRPNAGKSTLVNALLGENRVITSEKAGTTRDAIDTEFNYNGCRVVLTDTAGLRKKARVSDEVEKFSNLRALEAIRRSDVCLLLIEATGEMGEQLGEQDYRICQKIQEAGKGLIIGVNKWDLIDATDKTYDHMVKEILRVNNELEGVPFLAISALTGKRVNRMVDMALEVRDNLSRILGRDNVIRYFEQTVENYPHPMTSQGPARLMRCCQVMVDPVALAFEVSHPERVMPSYVRYLRRKAYEFFDLKGVPLRIWFRSRFQLRTDEELAGYVSGVRPDFREWDEADEADLALSAPDGSEAEGPVDFVDIDVDIDDDADEADESLGEDAASAGKAIAPAAKAYRKGPAKARTTDGKKPGAPKKSLIAKKAATAAKKAQALKKSPVEKRTAAARQKVAAKKAPFTKNAGKNAGASGGRNAANVPGVKKPASKKSGTLNVTKTSKTQKRPKMGFDRS